MWYLIYILIFRAGYIGLYVCKIRVYIYLHAFYISNICCKYQLISAGKYSNVENPAYCTKNRQLLRLFYVPCDDLLVNTLTPKSKIYIIVYGFNPLNF